MSELIEAVVLSFVAGWADTVSFLALGLFTSHITGNFVLIFVQIAKPGAGLLARVLSVPVFMAMVLGVSLAAERQGHVGPRTGRILLAIEALLLAVFMVAGAVLGPLRNPDALGAVAVGMIGVAAMAVQNAANRLRTPPRPSTTVMTTNISQVFVDLARFAQGERGEAVRSRLGRQIPSVLAFALGCAGGAGADRLAGFWGLAVPALLVGGAAVLARPMR